LPNFHIVFTDLDRNVTYVGDHQESGAIGHIMQGIQLLRQGGHGSISWSRLHLHTWNIDYLSGISIWNNTEFGMLFTRQHQ
jgi:hypothetical protein